LHGDPNREHRIAQVTLLNIFLSPLQRLLLLVPMVETRGRFPGQPNDYDADRDNAASDEPPSSVSPRAFLQQHGGLPW
jgi:hypothetical protein